MREAEEHYAGDAGGESGERPSGTWKMGDAAYGAVVAGDRTRDDRRGPKDDEDERRNVSNGQGRLSAGEEYFSVR